MKNSVGVHLTSSFAKAGLFLLSAIGFGGGATAAVHADVEDTASEAPVRAHASTGTQMMAEADGTPSDSIDKSDELPDGKAGKEKVVDDNGALESPEDLTPGMPEKAAEKRTSPKMHEWRDSVMGVRG